MCDVISREDAIAVCNARLKDLSRMAKTPVFSSAKPLIGAAVDEIEILIAGLRALPAVQPSPDVAGLVEALNNAIRDEARRQWEENPMTLGDFSDAPEVMQKLCRRAVLNAALARAGATTKEQPNE